MLRFLRELGSRLRIFFLSNFWQYHPVSGNLHFLCFLPSVLHSRLPYSKPTMPFIFGYQAADLSLRYLSFGRLRRKISGSVPKCEWHSTIDDGDFRPKFLNKYDYYKKRLEQFLDLMSKLLMPDPWLNIDPPLGAYSVG